MGDLPVSRKRVVGIVALVVLFVSALAAVAVAALAERSTGDAVAVVHLSGQVQEGSVGPFGPAGITPALVRERLEAAEGNPRVRAVVVRLDTPGGTVAAAQEIAQLLEDFPHPVVVSMGDMAASAGYYVAADADRIVAQPGTLTGSIGVIWAFFDVEGLLDRLGVEIDTVVAGEHKDMLLPGRLTPERREIVQDMTDLIYDEFVATVAEGRGLPEAEVRRLATGQLYTGRQALEAGLVDTLGGLEEAVDEAEELAGIDDAAVVDLRPRLLDQLFGSGPGTRLRQLLRPPTRVDDLTRLRQLLESHSVPRLEAP